MLPHLPLSYDSLALQTYPLKMQPLAAQLPVRHCNMQNNAATKSFHLNTAQVLNPCFMKQSVKNAGLPYAGPRLVMAGADVPGHPTGQHPATQALGPPSPRPSALSSNAGPRLVEDEGAGGAGRLASLHPAVEAAGTPRLGLQRVGVQLVRRAGLKHMAWQPSVRAGLLSCAKGNFLPKSLPYHVRLLGLYDNSFHSLQTFKSNRGKNYQEALSSDDGAH